MTLRSRWPTRHRFCEPSREKGVKYVCICLLDDKCRRAGFARPCAGAVGGVGEAQAASPRLAAASLPLAESPGRAQRAWHTTEIRCAHAPVETHANTLRTGTAGPVPCRKEAGGESERASGPMHWGRLQPVWCAVAGAWRAVRVQTQLGANRLLLVAWGSAGRSHAQVSALFAVFCDGRRTPRLRVLSLLRLCSDMLERARGSERRGVVILKCLECIERERGAL